MKSIFRHKAFTFIEIMIVTVILVLLASGIVFMNILRARQTADASLCLRNRTQIDQAEARYFTDKGNHSQNLQDLVSAGYLTSLPKCPAAGVYAWVPADTGTVDYQARIGCSVHGASIATPMDQNGIVYNFDSGNDNGWTKIGNKWNVQDGKYYGGRAVPAGGENRSFIGDQEWTDYTITLDANLLNGPGYGVYFRATDFSAVDAYCFQYDPGYNLPNGSFIVRKVTNGNEANVPLARYDLSAGYSWRDNEKSIKIEVSGSTFKAYVSDVNAGSSPVITFSDSSFSTGAIGLRTWSNAYASFDNITVTQNK